MLRRLDQLFLGFLQGRLMGHISDQQLCVRMFHSLIFTSDVFDLLPQSWNPEVSVFPELFDTK